MSDDYGSSPVSIDDALDNAFSAVGDDKFAAIEDGVLPPARLSGTGLWEQAQEIADAQKAKRQEKPKAEKSEKADRRGKGEKQDEDVSDSIDRAQARSAEAQQKRLEDRAERIAGNKPRPLNTRDFNSKETIQHRRELRERFPNQKLSERMATFERWEEAFRRDPVATRSAIMAEYLKLSPQNFGKEKPKTAESKHVGDAVDRAWDHAGDYADLKPFVEKYGDSLPHLLRQLNEIEKGLIEDPVGTSARLAANYGATDAVRSPAQAQQAQPQQLPPPASHAEDYQRVQQGLEKCIEHGILPALQNDQIAEAVADVLTRMPRTADRFADLQTAYHLVVSAQAEPAERNNKGQKSISGAPSPGSASRLPAKTSMSLDKSLDRAFGTL